MEWDLIGVAGIPEAADEYDCMISPLLHRLFEGADTRSLAGSAANGHLISGPDQTTPGTCGSPNRLPHGGNGAGPKPPDRRLIRSGWEYAGLP
jgi:hypothetical protein